MLGLVGTDYPAWLGTRQTGKAAPLPSLGQLAGPSNVSFQCPARWGAEEAELPGSWAEGLSHPPHHQEGLAGGDPQAGRLAKRQMQGCRSPEPPSGSLRTSLQGVYSLPHRVCHED